MGSHDASQGAGGGDSTALGRQMGSCCGTHLRVGVRGPFAVQAALESRGCQGRVHGTAGFNSDCCWKGRS